MIIHSFKDPTHVKFTCRTPFQADFKVLESVVYLDQSSFVNHSKKKMQYHWILFAAENRHKKSYKTWTQK